MKKIISTIFALILFACNGGDTPTPESTESSNSSESGVNECMPFHGPCIPGYQDCCDGLECIESLCVPPVSESTETGEGDGDLMIPDFPGDGVDKRKPKP